MKVSVPVTIPVAGRIIKVRYVTYLVDDKGEAAAGVSYPDELRIAVSKTQHKTTAEIFETLFHELDHIFYQVSGHSQTLDEGQEEALTYARQYMLSGLFVFNPKAGIKYRPIDFPWDED